MVQNQHETTAVPTKYNTYEAYANTAITTGHNKAYALTTAITTEQNEAYANTAITTGQNNTYALPTAPNAVAQQHCCATAEQRGLCHNTWWRH